MDAREWNDRYRAAAVWSRQPNAALVHFSPSAPDRASAAPRTALDLGCGEGADAAWLASRGWDVTGVDWAEAAVDRARRLAQTLEVRARFVTGDITDPAFLRSLSTTGTFGLVTVAFHHPEPSDRSRSYAHLPGLVSAGGHLLIIAHDPSHASRGFGGPPADRLLTPADVLEALDLPHGFDVLVATVWPRETDGQVVALDTVVLAHRRHRAQ